MLFRAEYLIVFLGATFGWQGQQSSGLTIKNQLVAATWNENTHRLSIVHQPSNQTFVRSAAFPEEVQEAKRIPIQHATFGKGQAIEFRVGDDCWQVQIYPRLPFVLVSGELHNSKSSQSKINHFPFATLEVDWGVSPSQLKTFGTGGLLAPAKNPGSYTWLAAVEPEGRNGIVVGWLTHDKGSGVLFSRVDHDTLFIDARLDYGQLTIAPSEAARLETLAIGFFDDARLGLEDWADAVAKVYNIHLPEQPTGYCTWYSKPHGGASDEEHLMDLAHFAADQLAPFGFSFVQIDDKWQAGISSNGPRRNFSTHDPAGPYPSGMQAIAKKIKSLGLTPGIWFMPFAGTYYDPYFANHQDWFVKHLDGSPYETKWGGTCLDLTEPGAQRTCDQLLNEFPKNGGSNTSKSTACGWLRALRFAMSIVGIETMEWVMRCSTIAARRTSKSFVTA